MSAASEACQHNTIFSASASAYISIRQHTSAYVAYAGKHLIERLGVSIRQHTSAYTRKHCLERLGVSIRRHTSAYVAYAGKHLIERLGVKDVDMERLNNALAWQN